MSSKKTEDTKPADPPAAPDPVAGERSDLGNDPLNAVRNKPNVTPGTHEERARAHFRPALDTAHGGQEDQDEDKKPAAERLGLDNPGSAAANLVAQDAERTGYSRPTDGQILTVLQQCLADVGQNERSGTGSAIRWLIARLPNDLKPEPLEGDEERQRREGRIARDQQALAEADRKERDRQAGR